MDCPALSPVSFSWIAALPPAVRASLCHDPHLHTAIVDDLSAPVVANLPYHLLIDAERLAAGSDVDRCEFFQAVARLFLRRLAPGPELEEREFVEAFAVVALRRWRGDKDYLPSASFPSPTQLLLRSLWHSEAYDRSPAELWEAAQQEARRRDPYRIARVGGTLLAQSQAVQAAGQLSRAALRFSKRFYWDVDVTLQDWVDPATSKSHLGARLQGKWEPLAVAGAIQRGDTWNLFPVATLEGRGGGSFAGSDLLILGGWKTEMTGRSSLYVQGGYSAHRMMAGGQRLPGVEIAAAVGQPLDPGGHWQVLGTLEGGGFGPLMMGALLGSTF